MLRYRAVVISLISLAACGREDISVRREAKETPAATAAFEPSAPAGLRWSAPAGWVEGPGGSMQVATFRLPAPSEAASVSVATFPGDVGGELANVNRWRGQLALPPVAEGELAALRERVETRAGAALLYDFTGPGETRTRLVAASLRLGDSTWFFKLNGPEAAVAAARPAFLQFLKGLRRDAA